MRKITYRLKTPQLEKQYQQLEIRLIREKKTAQEWFEQALVNSLKQK